jgi:hypothetical protein
MDFAQDRAVRPPRPSRELAGSPGAPLARFDFGARARVDDQSGSRRKFHSAAAGLPGSAPKLLTDRQWRDFTPSEQTEDAE